MVDNSLLINIKSKASTTGLAKTDKALKKVSKSAKEAGASAGFLKKLLRGGIAFAGFQGIKSAMSNYLQFEKDLGAMHSRFYAITGDVQQASNEFEYIRKLANETANDIKSTADSYSIFYASAKRALGQEGARGVFEAWTKIGRVLHLNEGQFERVTYALREMSSKGQLYASDLKMQLGTHVPDAVNIAETAIKNMGLKGVDTVEKFQQLTKKDPKGGHMGRFLIEFSKEAEKRFASPEALKKALQQPDALQQQIANLGQNFLIEFSKKGGSYMVVQILTSIYNTLLMIPFNQLSSFFGTMAKLTGLISKALPQIVMLLLAQLAIRGIRAGVGAYKSRKISLLTTPLNQFGFLSKKSIVGAYGFGGRRLLKLFSSGASLKKAINAGLLGAFAKVGLRTLIARVVAFLGGPIGIAISLLITFLPNIISWVKDLYYEFKYKNGNLKIGDTGYTLNELAKKAKDIQSMGFKDTASLNRYLVEHGERKLVNTLRINDQSQVIIHADGIGGDVVAEEIAKRLNDIEKRKSEGVLAKTGQFFANPGEFFGVKDY